MAQENRTEQIGQNQVLHVRGDSDSQLAELFRVLDPDGSTPQKSVPYNQRKLPPSFFTPRSSQPPGGHHSREGSADSTNYGPPPPPHPQGHLGPVHVRSRSSPAQLPRSSLSQPPPPPHTMHMKQASADFLEEMPLPPGWEVAKAESGQKYFLNHNTRTTTWQDPRKSLQSSPQQQPQQGPPPPPQTLSPAHSQGSLSPGVSMQSLQTLLGPLPPGWEQATTLQGEVYFINHNDRTTNWFDPRIPRHQQRAGMKVQELLHLQKNQAALNLQQQQQQHLQHSPKQMNTQQMSPPQQPMAVSSPPPPPVSSGPSSDISLQLLKVQREKEMLLARQKELMQQELLLQEVMNPQLSPPHPPTSQSGGDLINVNTSGVDPFLGQANSGENHARQNSADSGLGGMGTSYSLPRTPEDFLGNVDEMDATDGVKLHSQTDFNLNGIHTTGMELDSVADASDNPTAMDSEDLVPSLQEDISGELLDGKMDNLLTWL